MTKKSLLAIIFCCVFGISVIGVLIIAVLTDETMRGHSFSEEWEYNETHHWHICTDEGCETVSDKEAHIYGEGTVLREATCSEAGSIAYTCALCGYTLEEQTDTVEHKYGAWSVTIPATCSEYGKRQRKCEECGEIQTETTDMTEHSLVSHDAKEPSCTESGWEAYQTCSQCTYSTYQEKEPLGHLFTEYIFNDDSTCTENGTETAQCDRCTETHTRIQPNSATGHKYNETWHKNAEGHWRICIICGNPEKVEAHISSGSTTETEAEICSVCGYIINSTIGHEHSVDLSRWYYDETSHWRKCTGCEEKLSLAEHSGGKASCTEPAVCDICSQNYGGLLAHSFTQYIFNNDATCTEDGTKTAKCDHCDQEDTQTVVGSALGHIWTKTPEAIYISKEASCTDRAVYYKSCSRCNEMSGDTFEYGEPLGHAFATEWTQSPTEHWFACVNPGCSEIKGSEAHTYTESLKAASCTEDGYKQYYCEKCGYLYKTDVIYAYGHTFGDWETVIKATCTATGLEQRTCRCGETQIRELSQLQHDYVAALIETLDGVEQKTYECRNCKHSYIVRNAMSEVVYSNETISHCPADFTFDVIFDGSLTELMQNVTVIDAYFEDTEYEFSDLPGILQPYNVQQNGSGVWSILPQSFYEAGLTYRVTLKGGVRFAAYNGSVLYFSIDKDPTEEIELQEDVIFLGALEANDPGYFPYILEFSEDSDTMYLTMPKIGSLAVGDILCVGPAADLDEVIDGGAEDNSFGKILEIYRNETGAYELRLGCPSLEEIFERLDIYVEDLIDFDVADVTLSEGIEDQAVQSLYASEDFIEFLSTVKVAANAYLSERNYDTYAVTSRSFFDKISITPTVSIKGTTVKVGLTGSLDIPIKAQSQTLGNISISFTTTADVSFRLEVDLQLKYFLWVIPVGIQYFDFRLVQQDTFGFTFQVKFDMDYTLQQNNGGYILYSPAYGTGKTLHIAECRVMKNADESRKQYLSRDQITTYLNDPSVHECDVCNAFTRLNMRDLFIINEETNTFHIPSCSYAPSSESEHAKLSIQFSSVLTAQGYSPCEHCHPERREEQTFESYMFDSINYSDWNDAVSQITGWANSAGASEYSETGFNLCTLRIYVLIFTLNLDVRLNLSFKLEAAITYRYEVEHENVYGLRIDGGGARSYTERYQQLLANDLDAIGKAEFRAGIGIDAYLSVVGLSNYLRFGIYGEAGIYAEAAGVVHLSTADNNYAAAYLEAGLYAKIEAYYKAFFWEGSADIVNAQWPLWAYGYERAYHSFANHFDELSIGGNLSLTEAGLLDVNYFDLRTLSGKTSTLSPNGVAGQYTVSFNLESGEYCSVQNGVLVVHADAPCSFTDTLTVSVQGTAAWKEYVAGNSVFYLDEFSVPIVYYADKNHAYAEISRDNPDCTNGGSVTYTCTLCGDAYTQTLPALGHDFFYISDGNATCTQDGTESAVCIRCGLEDTRTVANSALGHDYIDHAGKPASCTESGWNEYQTCSRCDYTSYSELPELGHDYQDGMCTRCGDITEAEGLEFTLYNNSYYAVTGIGTCTAVNIRIPSVYNGKPVTAIDPYAFKNCTSVQNIAIPTSVTNINYSAFEGCGNLTSVTFDDNSQLTGIGLYAFSSCNSLMSIEIPAGVTYIGSSAFKECSGLTSIEIPNNVTSIGTSAFWGCSSLKSVTFGNNSQLPDMGNYAFYGCSSLTSIIVPDSVTSIGECAFYNCALLTGITIPDSVTSIGNYAFFGCSSLTSIGISDSVRSIGVHAFYGCSSLTSIELPAGVTSIGAGAFYDCSSLTSIELPASVTNIGAGTFDGCSSLASIEIPDSVTSIGSSAFDGCSSLTSITIPANVTSIGDYTFYGCSSLTSIEIPAGVTSIGDYTFEGCSNLTSVTFDDNNQLTSIGISAFWGCSSLKSITFGDNNRLTSIGNNAFFGCSNLTSVYISDIAAWCAIDFVGSSSNPLAQNLYLNGKLVTELIIPAGVTSIGDYTFEGCSNLTSVTFDDNNQLMRIGNSAFSGCSNLTSIEIPDSVTSIGSSAFYRCISLTSIEIPAGVMSIGERTFYNCSSLTSVIFGANSQLTSIGTSAFWGCSSLTSIEIPTSVTSISNSAFRGCSSLTSITIPASVTSIGGGAFQECSGLKSVIFAENSQLTSIGNSTFYGCGSLTSIELPAGVTSINNSAFRSCSNLASITIPAGVTSIGDRAFQECSSLTSVIFGENSQLTSMGDYAFLNCRNLTSIAIPAGVTSIGYSAFWDCSSLTSIAIPAGVTSIGYSVFAWCNNLTSVTFGENSQLTSIGDSAFYGCSSLTSITIPAGVTSIGNSAFYNCNSLKNIYYIGTTEEWLAINIGPNNTTLTSATVYYYSEELTEEQKADDNNYWRYVDGVPTVWTKETT